MFDLVTRLETPRRWSVTPHGKMIDVEKGWLTQFMDKVEGMYVIGVSVPNLCVVYQTGDVYITGAMTNLVELAVGVNAVARSLPKRLIIVFKNDDGEKLIHHLQKMRCRGLWMNNRGEGRTLKDFGFDPKNEYMLPLMFENASLILRLKKDMILDEEIMKNLPYMKVSGKEVSAKAGYDWKAPLAYVMALWAMEERKPEMIRTRHLPQIAERIRREKDAAVPVG